MDLSYREKGIWISLTTQLIAYLIFFVELHLGAFTPVALLYAILAIIILQIILQSILAITTRAERKDERDLAIERVAYRNAYFVLDATLIACLPATTLSPPLRSHT